MDKKNKKWTAFFNEVLYDDEERRQCEICVVCHRLTDIRVDTPIEKRMHYFEGAGQLCDSCWEQIYGKMKNTANGK